MIEKINTLQFLTATLIIEVFMLFLFRYTNSPFSGKSINVWYDKFRWGSVILDVMSVMIGFYLAKYLYEYLVSKNIMNRKYEFLKYIVILLLIQITHDILFYIFVILPTPKNSNLIIDELKSYSKKVGSGAIIGDSFMYIVATPILFYLIARFSNETNSFISIVCLYLIGYFLYQKPLYVKY